MNSAMIQRFVVALAWLAAANAAQAQVMLVGCTSDPGSTPLPSALVDINLLSGSATNLRNIGISLAGISTQPTTGYLFALTSFYSSTPNALLRVDAMTGAPTNIGPTGLPGIVEGDLAFNPIDGQLYGVQDVGVSGTLRNFFRIDPNTGSATIIANLVGTQRDFSALAFNPSGTLFGIDTGSGGPGNSLLLTIDANTGAFTSTVSMNVNLGGAAGMAFNPLTGSAYVADGASDGTALLYALDVGTGMLSPVGPTGVIGGICGLAFVTVPEPSSLTLAGLTCLLAGRRMLRSLRRL